MEKNNDITHKKPVFLHVLDSRRWKWLISIISLQCAMKPKERKKNDQTLRIQSTMLAFALHTHIHRCEIVTRAWFYVCGILFGRTHSSSSSAAGCRCFFASLRRQYTWAIGCERVYESISLSRLTNGEYLKFIIHCVCFCCCFQHSLLFVLFEFGFLSFAHALSLYLCVGIAPHNMNWFCMCVCVLEQLSNKLHPNDSVHMFFFSLSFFSLFHSVHRFTTH